MLHEVLKPCVDPEEFSGPCALPLQLQSPIHKLCVRFERAKPNTHHWGLSSEHPASPRLRLTIPHPPPSLKNLHLHQN